MIVSPSPIGVYGAIGTFAAADLNGDGKLDLVFPDAFDPTPGGSFSLIYLGNGRRDVFGSQQLRIQFSGGQLRKSLGRISCDRGF